MPSVDPPRARPWPLRLVLEHRIAVSAVLVLVFLTLIHPSRRSVLAGLPLIALGEGLRLWASGHIHKMQEVTCTGPYALCRHPLYFGHFLIALGFSIAGGNVGAAVLALAGFWLIFQPTMANEERMLLETFGAAYEDYRRRTPRFWPRWSPRARDGGHSWRLVAAHREWNNVIGLALFLALFAGIGLWRGTW